MTKRLGLALKIFAFVCGALLLSLGELDETGRLMAPPIIKLAALGLIFFVGDWLYTRRARRP